MRHASSTLAAQDERSIFVGQRRLDELVREFASAEHVVHWNERAQDPAAAAMDLVEEATGSRPREPLFAFAAYLMHLRAHSQQLVVVIDDLDAISPQQAQWLRETLDSSRGTLRALASAADHAAVERATARLGLALVPPLRPAPAREPRRWWRLGAASVAFGAAVVLAALLAVLG